ncbi:MAG TPA: cyclase family protein [Thermoanaerobacterales bacterium]|nr:cyclase family protein [Thermoanaerobacterales bacterium]
MKFIDISMTLENDVPSDPEIVMPKIEYQDHEDTKEAMASLLGPDATPDDLSTGLGYANEKIIAYSHSATHLDAPWHYYPTMNNGERAWGIDEIPLEWCFGDGVVADFSEKPDGYEVTGEDFEEYFKKIDYTLKPKDIVLIMSGAQRNWGKPEYINSGCGVGRDGTMYLLDRGIRVCGTDAWGWDPPFKYMAENYKKTGDKSKIWGGHLAGMEKAYCHLEKLVNLDKLPPYGFKVCCFPIKVKGASAGWTRAVAIIDE